jgi:hypothetical protein
MSTHTEAPAAPCTCESCNPGDLPVNPFLALRVAYGMLLGEDDFRTMMGHPRGKHMLHQAWQHGPGVVWGYRVRVDGVWTLQVSPGLAVDGLGRDLLSDATECLDVREWLKDAKLPASQECRTQTIEACLTVEFGCCPTDPVPTLADPCDITRKHDDYSRVVERARLVLKAGCCPCPPRPYHRVRVLLGLDSVGQEDRPGEQALRALRCVLERPEPERARELLRQFRRMAAKDVADIEPSHEDGESWPTLFPVLPADAAVVLACVEIDVRETDGCSEIVKVRPDIGVRTALIPTTTIQELTCGPAPGVLGDLAGADAGGPRVIPGSVVWGDEAMRLSFQVTAPLVPGSVTRRAVRLTSLAERGWIEEDLYSMEYDEGSLRVVVNLADRPANELVRLIVRGTGGTPVFGKDPAVPLAGLVGGPPGTVNDGHDAILTLRNPLIPGAQS